MIYLGSEGASHTKTGSFCQDYGACAVDKGHTWNYILEQSKVFRLLIMSVDEETIMQ